MHATALDLSPSAPHAYSDMQLLIVDDEPYNVEILEEILSDVGYARIQGCSDPRRVLELCAAQKPDLILLDLQMPHLDGFQLLELLKTTPALSQIPTVVITAQSKQDYRLRALNAGAKDYIVKPFNPGEVLSRIHNLLETQHLQNDLQQQNQELARINKTMSELVSIVSHELRTPLTSIKSFVEILRDDADDLDQDSKTQFLGIIDTETDRLTRMIANLLDLQKISSGKMAWKTELVDIVKLAHEAVSCYQSAFEEKGLSLELEPDLYTAGAMIDADKMSQVFTNLLSNALKFTQQGGVTIHIKRTSDWANVVILSDDDDSVSALTRILTSQSITPYCYRSQDKALTHLQCCGGNLDLMIVDISNNSAGNIAFLETVRDRHPSLPIISIVMEEKQRFGQRRNPFQRSSFIKKPIDVEQSRSQIELQIIDMIGISARASMIEVNIKDSGCGIEEQDRSRVFERFHQADTSHTREQSGTGLGLTVCKEIVTHFHGKIWVENNPHGQGSNFKLILPEFNKQKKKLGEILIEKGLVTEEQISSALKDQT